MKSQKKKALTLISYEIVIFSLMFFIFLPTIVSYGEIYKFRHMWPVLKEPWYFKNPFGLEVDSDGYIYVADSQNHHIHKFSADGEFVAKWGKNGSGDGDFNHPYGITVDSKGYIYIADSQNHRVQKFRLDGQYVTQWDKWINEEGRNDKFNLPIGIAVSKSGYVYISDKHNNRILKFNTEGRYIAGWTNFIGEDNVLDYFDWPIGIAISNDDYIYVADSRNDRILKFKSDGEYIIQLGHSGSGDGQLRRPSDITVDNDDFVYVVDKMNHRVQKFNKDGEYKAQWGVLGSEDREFNSPEGIALAGDGYIYIADSENDRIQKFSRDGHFITRWGRGNKEGEFNSPDGLTIDENDFIYVADTENNRIQKFGSNGNILKVWGTGGSGDGEFIRPCRIGVSFSAKKYVYITDNGNHRVQKFDENGEYIAQWGKRGGADGEFIFPTGIAVNQSGDVYVTDLGNHRVQKFDENGKYLDEWGKQGEGQGEFKSPWDIATDVIDDEEVVYVADTKNHRIQKFDENGEFLGEWGKYGTGDGEFDQPNGITIDSNSYIYVTDMKNNRIQKFNPSGEFQTKWGEAGNFPGQMKYPGAGAVDSKGNFYIPDNNNHRIQVFERVAFLPNNKVIIVAGGGPYLGNNLWDATQVCANTAYWTLIYQGYTRDTVYYLSSAKNLDLDGNGKPDDVDEVTSYVSLQQAFKWAEHADDLIIYLVDHGATNKFRLTGRRALTSSDLSSWLNSVSKTLSGNEIIIYDACKSGSFLSSLANPNNNKRIVITSTNENQDAHFLSQGSISFSDFFWSNIFMGSPVIKAFQQSQISVSEFTELQNPLLDCDGDGQRNIPEECETVQDIKIGSGTDSRLNIPIIDNVNVDENSATLQAEIKNNEEIARVWAVIIPPGYHQTPSENPVLELPSIDLKHAGDGLYTAAYDKFNIKGKYQVVFNAMDKIGNTSVPKPDWAKFNPLLRKAIIVAGTYQTDKLKWPAIRQNADMAYNALTLQGYRKEDIYIIGKENSSKDTDWKPATLTSLSDAIKDWATLETQDLVIYLAGNGEKGAFQINDSETLSAKELDSLLDELQKELLGRVTVIYDADYSGSFLPLLTPDGSERILISSSSADQSACFLSNGDISFSSFFWKGILNGMNVQNAFRNARDIRSFMNCRDTRPQLDDTGNGIGNEEADGKLAQEHIIGEGIKRAGFEPIGTIKRDITLTGSLKETIQVDDVITGNTNNIWAEVLPPDYNYTETFSPPEYFPKIELSCTETGVCKGTSEVFSNFGVYHVNIYTSGQDNYALLIKELLVLQIHKPDIYEPDNDYVNAGNIAINFETPQQHNFHDDNDVDWVKFYGLSQAFYKIEISNQGENCDAGVELYNETDLSNPIETYANADDIRDWGCEQDGIYYVKIMNNKVLADNDSHAGYDLEIITRIGPLWGLLVGTIKDKNSDKAVGGARIRTSDNHSAISFSNGAYVMVHPPNIEENPVTVTVEANCYMPDSSDVTITEGGRKTLDFDLTSDICDDCPYDPDKKEPGICGCGVPDTDSNGDGIIDCKADSVNDCCSSKEINQGSACFINTAGFGF